MYSIGFPDIFNGSTVFLDKDYEAIKNNLELLLGSNVGGLYGDPQYGTKIKTTLWDQAHEYVMKTLTKEDLFEAIYSYMPQVEINRDDIEVEVVGNFVEVTIKAKGDAGIKTDLLTLQFMKDELTKEK